MQLLRSEVLEALNSLPPECKSAPIYSRLVAANDMNVPRVGIQFESNELEQLIDCMGAPLPTDSPTRKSLRKKIQTFVYYLHNQSLQIKD